MATDILEHMSFEEGVAYNDRLMPIARGEAQPDRSVPMECIFYDLWNSMRAHDRELTDEMLKPVFELMQAQTDKIRGRNMGLGEYMEYRERDIGKS